MGSKTTNTTTDFYISPRYKASDYLSIQLTENSNREDWEKAINIFKDRINGRFLKYLEIIINQDTSLSEFCGFIVIAIDCLVIETLSQFFTGQKQTKGDHTDAFWRVFVNSDSFKNEINYDQTKVFYDHFRCGLLHQAQTKKLSRIKISRPRMIEQVDSINVNGGLIVDREKFHTSLISTFEQYCNRLISPSLTVNPKEHHTRVKIQNSLIITDVDLRKNFIKKMEYIARNEA